MDAGWGFHGGLAVAARRRCRRQTICQSGAVARRHADGKFVNRSAHTCHRMCPPASAIDFRGVWLSILAVAVCSHHYYYRHRAQQKHQFTFKGISLTNRYTLSLGNVFRTVT